MREKTNSQQFAANLISQTADWLATHGMPAVSSYELAKYVFMHTNLSSVEEATFKSIFSDLCDEMLNVRLLTQIAPISETRGYILFGKGSASPAEVMCSLDPFAYVSHLSAMEYHGLTDRFPKILYMTRPAPGQWREQARVRMARDLGARLQVYLDSGLPKLLQSKITRLGQTSIHFCERSQLGAFRLVAGSSLRVATVSRVFLEMIREPAQCGGIQHVIDVYRREAKRYINLIVDEVSQHGLAIDKVRAGFLLSEVCRLEHEVFVEWEKSAQRGGSRKLDPEGEYVSEFSERWKLSLNVPSVIKDQEDE